MAAAATITVRLDTERKARWQSLAQARGLTLTAFLFECVEGSSLPASAEREVLRAVERTLPEYLDEALRRDLDEVLEAKVAEAVESSTLDPAQVEYRLGLLEQAVRNLNQALNSGRSEEQGFHSEPVYE